MAVASSLVPCVERKTSPFGPINIVQLYFTYIFYSSDLLAVMAWVGTNIAGCHMLPNGPKRFERN